jgi:hypothetical protein
MNISDDIPKMTEAEWDDIRASLARAWGYGYEIQQVRSVGAGE